MNELLTTSQAAKFLGVSTATVYRMEKRGLIESRRTPGGQRRFLKTDLETYIEQAHIKTWCNVLGTVLSFPIWTSQY